MNPEQARQTIRETFRQKFSDVACQGKQLKANGSSQRLTTGRKPARCGLRRDGVIRVACAIRRLTGRMRAAVQNE
jgi:hypothetical protein